MTKLRGIELPDEIVEVYKKSILDAEDELILAVAKRSKDMIQGMRPIKQNVPNIKKRLISKIGREKQITHNQLVVLSHYRPLGFLGDFSFQTLDHKLDGLCGLHGRNEVVASLLLDSRDDARELAKDVLSGDREVKELSEEEKLSFASEEFVFFNPFIRALIDMMNDPEEDGENSSPAAEAEDGAHPDKELLAKLNKRVEELEERNKKLSAERRKYKKRASKCDAAEKAREKADKENIKLRQRLKEVEKLQADAVAQYEILDRAIAATVDEQIHSVLHNWIIKPEILEQASQDLKQAGQQDIVQRAVEVIEKQNQIDKHAGNRSVIIKRLERVSELKREVKALAIESINPLKELSEVAQHLDQEVCRLERLLNTDCAHSEFVQSFLSKIGMASHPDELSSLKHVLAKMSEFQLLPRKDMRTLYEHYDERMSLLYEKYVPDISSPRTPIDPVYRIKRTIAENKPLLWLLDGHNILFSLREMFGTLDEKGQHTESSRKKLGDLLVQLTKDAPECEVQVFYDSPEYNEIPASPNVKVIYSGGEGDHRADDAICSALEYRCYLKSDIPFLLTSDDYELRSRADRLGAHLMDINEFFVFAWAYNRAVMWNSQS